MDDLVKYTELFDCYGKLLTEKQQEYFIDYYFNNLTLSELSENYQISRNAIHKQLKIVIQKLEEYEEKLGFLSKQKLIKEKLEEINDERISKILDLMWGKICLEK